METPSLRESKTGKIVSGILNFLWRVVLYYVAIYWMVRVVIDPFVSLFGFKSPF